MTKSRVTVLGIGNILLQDEGFGVRVVEEFGRRYETSKDVQILDGGTLGMELLRFLTGTEKLIIVDAIAGDLPPGSFYRFKNEEVKAYFREKVSMHELGIQDVLKTLEVLEEPIKEIVVYGIQPQSLDIGLDLTPTVAALVELAVETVAEQLRAWDVEVTAK